MFCIRALRLFVLSFLLLGCNDSNTTRQSETTGLKKTPQRVDQQPMDHMLKLRLRAELVGGFRDCVRDRLKRAGYYTGTMNKTAKAKAVNSAKSVCCKEVYIEDECESL